MTVERWRWFILVSVVTAMVLIYHSTMPNFNIFHEGGSSSSSSSYSSSGHVAFTSSSSSSSSGQVALATRGQEIKHSGLDRRLHFDIDDGDVLVFLRVQKTGSSSMNHKLITTLLADPPCSCIRGVNFSCRCVTHDGKPWLFSGDTSRWACGLHADYTELPECLDSWFERKNDHRQRRYHYITSIRNPVDRFISEWQQQKRHGGVCWNGSRHMCNGRRATLQEVPYCWRPSNEGLLDISLDMFVGCKHNLAINRMTRMFSDLTKVNCYNRSHLDPEEVNRVMLESAKENLANFAFFSILERPQESQFLFESTFGMNFSSHFLQRITRTEKLKLSDEMLKKVERSNKLDIPLYQFAQDIFRKRVRKMEELLGYTVNDYFTRYRRPEVENAVKFMIRKKKT